MDANDVLSNSHSASLNADYYDERWQNHGRNLSKQRALRMNFIVNALFEISAQRSFNSLNILDLGCGNGWMAPFLHPFGKVQGIDYSPDSIKSARDVYAYCGEFLLADPSSKRMGIPDDTLFDVIVCSEVIEHTVNHLAFLRQLNSLLVPSGFCILTTPNGNLWKWYQVDSKNHIQPIENWLNPRGLRAAFIQSGFRILRHTGGIFSGYCRGMISAFLQHKRVVKMVYSLGFKDLYSKILLPVAFYQLAVAQKI